ncbi:hypothetical protein [Hydrogenispora ethanolica]|uniref:hypothetical protein n=1 Tax=Hydrogenispora ethanolica TaxID=1082276 RepID=UPI00140477FF|nr:hypothetical protein [Hydrogenispora ethanolica]
MIWGKKQLRQWPPQIVGREQCLRQRLPQILLGIILRRLSPPRPPGRLRNVLNR